MGVEVDSIEDSSPDDVVKPVHPFFHFMVSHTKSIFGITLFVQLLFPGITGLLCLLGHTSDVFPADFTDVPLVLQNENCYKRTAAWNSRNKDPNEPIFQPEFVKTFSRTVPADIVELYYEVDDGKSNILTSERLRRVRDFEASLANTSNFDQYCVLDLKGSCRPVRSLSNMVTKMMRSDSINTTTEDIFHNSDSLKKYLRQYYQMSPADFKDFVSKDVKFDSDPISASMIRSYFFISWTSKDIKGEVGQKDHYTTKDYMRDTLSQRLWNFSHFGAEELSGIRFYYYNSLLHFDYLKTQVIYDQMLAIGSFLFITVFLWIESQSIFITIFGILGIVNSFFGANLVYRYVFDFKYFGVFHVLSIFIILGIGVDDIFIYYDTWVASEDRHFASLDHRLADVFYHAATSMLITSLSTAISFYTNAISPLLAISSFGLFSGLLVTVNFIAVMAHFPSVVLMHHQYFKDPWLTCGRSNKPAKLVNSHSSVTITGSETDAIVVAQPKATRSMRISKHMCSWYFGFIWNPGIQVVLMILTVMTLGFLTFSATKLTVDTEPVKLYRDTHLLGHSTNKRKMDFYPPFYLTNTHTEIYLVWGISGMDRSHCHKSDWKNCEGIIEWDDTFDMNPYHAQRDLLQFCKRLRKLPQTDIDKLRIKTTDGSPDVNCFVESMDSFFEKEMRSYLVTNRNVTGLPTSDKRVEAMMIGTPTIYNISAVLQNPFFYRYFETAMMFWLYDGYKSLIDRKALPQLLTWHRYHHLIGHSIQSSDIQVTKLQDEKFYYGTKLRYAAIQINSTLVWDGIPYSEGLQVLQAWDDFIEKEKSELSPTLRNVYVATPDRNGLSFGMCHWFKIQENLVQSAMSGIIMSIALAFPILVLSTDDLLIGFLATLTITGATVSVVGVIPLAGWKIGALESLNLTMIVGLAIDYIVHVAQGFHLSKGITRKDKIEQVLHEIGISVFAGAGTTLGASFFMLFAQILFFHQHGLFMFCTTAFALFYAMVALVILLSRFGPETNKYSLSGALKRAFRACFKRQKPTEDDFDRPDTTATETESICTTTTSLDGSGLPGIKFRPHSRVAGEETIISQASKQTKLDRTRLRVLRKDPNDSNSSSIDDDNISSGYESGAMGVPKMLSCQMRPKNNLVSLPPSDVSDESPEVRRKGLATAKTTQSGQIETILEETGCNSERTTPVAIRAHHHHSKPLRGKHNPKRTHNAVEPLNPVALSPVEPAKIHKVLEDSEDLVRLAQKRVPPAY